MKSGVWQRFDFFARNSTPFVITMFLVVIGAVPTRLPEFANIAPALTLMAVYHWSIYRPELMPAWAVFFLGVAQDALAGTPFGVSSFVFLAVHMAVLSQGIFFTGKSFAIVWLGFSMVAAAAFIVTWLLVSLFFGQSTGVLGMFFQYLVTIGTYPILSWLLMMWQQKILTEE